MTPDFGEPPLLPSVLEIGKAPLLGPGFSSVRFARSFRVQGLLRRHPGAVGFLL